MGDAKIIGLWLDSLSLAKELELRLFLNTQSDLGYFFIERNGKEIFKSESISVIFAFLKGWSFK